MSERNTEKWVPVTAFITSFILLFLTQSPLYLQGMYIYSWGLFAKKGILFDVMAVLSVLAIIYNFIILSIAHRKCNNDYDRHRLLFLLIGSASSAILMIGNFPAMNGYNVYPPGNFVFITTSFFAIALFRYNRNEMIRLFGTFLYYSATVVIISTGVYLINISSTSEYFLSISVFTILIILTLNFILRQLKDHFIGKHEKQLENDFESLVDVIAKSKNICEISNNLSVSFYKYLLCSDSSVLFFENEFNQYRGERTIIKDLVSNNPDKTVTETISIDSNHPLIMHIDSKYSFVSSDEIESIILNFELNVPTNDPIRSSKIFLPVFFENFMIAIILLGMKTDTSAYTPSELKFLYHLSISLGPYIENAKIQQNLEETLKNRTRELVYSEKKYRNLIENTNEVIYKTNWKGDIIYANPAFQKKFGYTDEELKKLNYRDLIRKDYRENEYRYYKRYLKEEIDVSKHELPAVTKYGEIIWLVQDIKTVRDKKGRIKEFDCIVHDITKKKIAENALRESENNYQQLMTNLTDCVFICKPDGHFKYVNTAITRMTGIPREKFIGTHFLSLIHPDYKDKLLELYKRQIEENIETTYCEFPIITYNNDTIWSGQTVRMTRNSSGEIEFYGIARDISDKKMEEKARRDLENAKTRFFSNISHEIRTPLTLMLGPIESVLRGDYIDEIDEDFFANLHKNTLSLLKLVNNLLDFSKIEAGKMTLEVQENNIVEFASRYISQIKFAGKTKDINTEINSESSLINLFFDPEKMDKIFMNMLSNSLKFTQTGGKISIDITKQNGFCKIKFSDTGEGISEDDILLIFDRFSQVNSQSSKRHGGTGIGLALVKELVESHGGIIEVESRDINSFPQNHGTEFTITLPMGKKHLEGMKNIIITDGNNLNDYIRDYRMTKISQSDIFHDVSPGQENTNETPLKEDNKDKKSILVVDDNQDMRNFIKALLKDQYHIMQAEEGESGLKTAKNFQPDLIISDVMMPGMDGFEMTSKIKADSTLNMIPVILLTADTDMMKKITGFKTGADDYLHKPFNSLELKTRISSLLKNYENQKIIAMRNQEIEKELEVARMLQQRLLPRENTIIPGYNNYAVYMPMDKVGGDFYTIELKDGLLNVVMADVSGHGLPGAFLATVTKIALENISDKKSPAKTLSLLNKVILNHTVNSNFVTVFFASIDTESRTMLYSSAGHLPPYLYEKERNRSSELSAKGIPLGWEEDIQFEEKMVQLESGNRIVLYTDGIIEAENRKGELYGEKRLQKSIDEYANLSPEKFTQNLIDQLKHFNEDRDFNDDITMLVVDVE